MRSSCANVRPRAIFGPIGNEGANKSGTCSRSAVPAEVSARSPTVAPVQLTGLTTDDVITGRINAADADGDEIRYRLVSGPRAGSVVLNDDGTYIYTPGARFDGSPY